MLFYSLTFNTNDDGIWWTCLYVGFPSLGVAACCSPVSEDRAETLLKAAKVEKGLLEVCVAVNHHTGLRCTDINSEK